jgi:hypothetical protein
MPGTYTLDLYLGEAEDFDAISDAISFEVLAADLNGTGRLAPPSLGPTFCAATFESFPDTHAGARKVFSYHDGSRAVQSILPASVSPSLNRPVSD